MEHLATKSSFRLLIDGREVDSADGQWFATHNPATNELLAKVASASATDVDRAVAAARAAFDNGPWSRTAPNRRGHVLRRIADAIRTNSGPLADLETQDSGKTIANARNEVDAAAEVFEYYAGWPDKLFGDTVPVGEDAMSITVREPVGVAAQITPWNFPILAASWKLAPALAAGCTVVLKPAAQAPLTTLAVGHLCHECGIPAGAVNVLVGETAQIGQRLVEHHDVDKVAFTGATSTGTKILQASADRIARVSLELGGKSPNVIFADADLDRAVAAAVKTAFGNGGQSCSARARILVQSDVYDEFLRRFTAAAEALRVGDPRDERTDVGPLITPEHWQAVDQYVQTGREEGADLILGGSRPEKLSGGNYYEPTIFSGVDDSSRLSQEEIFGPVALVLPFSDEDQAVSLANNTEYGLNASVWTESGRRALRMSRRIRAGMVTLNSHGSASRYALYAPFGGMKKSGLGRELGAEGIEMYTETKNIFIDTSTPHQ